ncbi:hypothetical protein HW555_010910 [Spodoptera exigua]|uniref:HTH psq-type domain-containing protein n=1 Tax=Spodoptera exigua TaxID=7107 RepID=A0A835L0G9_SPOEX|nr:hypothetical protein HW555_010910 [Spodoptera exigua]
MTALQSALQPTKYKKPWVFISKCLFVKTKQRKKSKTGAVLTTAGLDRIIQIKYIDATTRKTETKYKLEDLEKAVHDVRNKILSLGKASIIYSVPKSTIHGYLKKEIINEPKTGRKAIFTDARKLHKLWAHENCTSDKIQDSQKNCYLANKVAIEMQSS